MWTLTTIAADKIKTLAKTVINPDAAQKATEDKDTKTETKEAKK